MEDVFKVIAKTCDANLVTDIKDADYVFVAEPIDAVKEGCKENAEIINSYELDRISAEFCDIDIDREYKIPEGLEHDELEMDDIDRE